MPLAIFSTLESSTQTFYDVHIHCHHKYLVTVKTVCIQRTLSIEMMSGREWESENKNETILDEWKCKHVYHVVTFDIVCI